MSDLRFEWDDRRNGQNRRKHGVSFEEAESVFSDEWALLIAGPEHSDAEDWFVLIGLSTAARTLVVCHCLRAGGDVIRIISARKADRTERSQYRHRLER